MSQVDPKYCEKQEEKISLSNELKLIKIYIFFYLVKEWDILAV